MYMYILMVLSLLYSKLKSTLLVITLLAPSPTLLKPVVFICALLLTMDNFYKKERERGGEGSEGEGIKCMYILLPLVIS